MEKINNVILGAGIGGLAMGNILGVDHLIFEKNESVPKNFHNGVHYFHSIPDIKTSVEFKKIRCDELVFNNRKKLFNTCTFNDAVVYAKKVLGIAQPTSIMSIGHREECFLPKSNSANDLIEDLEKNCRILLNTACEKIDVENKIIIANGKKYQYENIFSTLPLNILLWIIGEEFNKDNFQYNKIFTWNFKIKGVSKDWLICVYIADEEFVSYRMTCLNGFVSVESVDNIDEHAAWIEVREVFDNFEVLSHGTSGDWETGKIVSIDEELREKIIRNLMKKNIFTFGRYGLWNRRLLIDSTIEQAVAIGKYFERKMEKEILIKFLSKKS